MPLKGEPLLSHLFASLAASQTLDDFIVATSTSASDDAIANFARERGVPCFRGQLQDVADRLFEAGRACAADAIARVNADSPLMDPSLIDQAVKSFRSHPVDVVTNAFPRTFPKGQGVELIAMSALQRALKEMAPSSESHEHVSTHFYLHPQQYTIRSFMAAKPRPEVQLSVDTAADLLHCEDILSSLHLPPWKAGWETCVSISDALRIRDNGDQALGVTCQC